MKKSTASRIACKEALMETVAALIPFIPWPVEVKKPDGSVILKNNQWDEDISQSESDMYELFVYGSEREHLMSVWIYKPKQMTQTDLAQWEKSAQELKKGLAMLTAGRRITLPPPELSDPLAEVKIEFNSAIESVERLISVSKLF